MTIKLIILIFKIKLRICNSLIFNLLRNFLLTIEYLFKLLIILKIMISNQFLIKMKF